LNHTPLERHQFSPSLAQLLLSPRTTYKIGFPGWPDPNLDSVPVFWGVSLEKGACTSPLFHSAFVLRGGWPLRDFSFPRVASFEVVFDQRARSVRALLLSRCLRLSRPCSPLFQPSQLREATARLGRSASSQPAMQNRAHHPSNKYLRVGGETTNLRVRNARTSLQVVLNREC